MAVILQWRRMKLVHYWEASSVDFINKLFAHDGRQSLAVGIISFRLLVTSVFLFVIKFWEQHSTASFGLWKEKLGFNLTCFCYWDFFWVLLAVGFNLLGGRLHIQGEQFNLEFGSFLVNFFFRALAEEMIYRLCHGQTPHQAGLLHGCPCSNSLLFAIYPF